MQKSWVKLSRSLRNKTKSSRQGLIKSPRGTTIKQSKATINLTGGEEEAKEVTEVSIADEVEEAVELIMEKANLDIAGEDTTRGLQTAKPEKRVVLSDPTTEAKEVALMKVNLSLEETTEAIVAIVVVIEAPLGEKEEAIEAKEDLTEVAIVAKKSNTTPTNIMLNRTMAIKVTDQNH